MSTTRSPDFRVPLGILLTAAAVLSTTGCSQTSAADGPGAAPAAAAGGKISGEPGAPSAIVVIDGKQIPAPPMKFGGVIKETTQGSKPYWPPSIVPPKKAPNVLLIMTDDKD